MLKRILASVVVAGGWLVAGGALQAHHSLAGVYDMKGEKAITGTLTTATFIPARDGSPLGFLKSITLADGKVIMISAGNPND